MNLKSPDEIVDALVKKYTVTNDNLILMRRLFVAASVVRWAFSTTSRVEEILQYLGQVEKYLDGEIDLYWEDEVIKVARVKRGKQ